MCFSRTSKINVNGILIEYEGEDSGIGLLFASKAAVQVPSPPIGNRAPDNCVIPPPIRKFVLFWYKDYVSRSTDNMNNSQTITKKF